ncbi:MAG: exodeoxyribonuclease III [Candidatus Poseidoniaceae archaeon]|jgi:exodeoxyribonuclease-3|nr:exodeoxyribonuclease III [Candidatus Poseidoniaceae archaeon]
MRIVTWNVNGIRAAIRKGLDRYFEEIKADVWMLQETRCLEEQLPKDWSLPQGYDWILHPATKKGYSGVATISKLNMIEIGRGKGGVTDPIDSEGRVLITKHEDLLLVNTYLPSGSSKDERQTFKEQWMKEWREFVTPLFKQKTPVILAGDLNIAHTEDDIWNPKGNSKMSGFLPQEREWLTNLLEDGWCDLFREHTGPGIKEYSWWSNRGQARAKDRGWRIDYLLGNKAAKERLSSCRIMRKGGLEVSDHAPVILELH